MTLKILKGEQSQGVGSGGYAGNRRIVSGAYSLSRKGGRTLIGARHANPGRLPRSPLSGVERLSASDPLRTLTGASGPRWLIR